MLYFTGEVFRRLANQNRGHIHVMLEYCSASEVRHPSEVRHLHFMTILKSFYCPVTAYMYTLPLTEVIPFIQM